MLNTSKNRFLKLLETHPYLLADGATGTNLFQAGLQTGDPPELWNTDQPDKIRAHYQAFADAGSDIILSNTFGGTKYRLKLHQAQDRVSELNIAGAKLAREVADSSGRVIAVGGCIGPTGEILEPSGTLTKVEAAAAFRIQGKALKAGGVDVFWIETLSSIEEVEAAVEGVSDLGLPIVFTMSIDTNGRTMMGITPAQIIGLSGNMAAKVHACGTNCGVGASEVVATVMSMNKVLPESSEKPIIIAKANAGIPQWQDGKIVYNGTPALMARYVQLALEAGARIVGGCCGTSYAHVAAMREAMDAYKSGEGLDLEKIQSDLGAVTDGAVALLKGEDMLTEKQDARKQGRRRRRA